MRNLGRYRKFIVAVLTAAFITVQAAYTDGTITSNEWGKIALAAFGAALVYLIRNDQRVVSRADLAARVERDPQRPPFDTP